MMPLTLPGGTGVEARHFTSMVVALALAGTALLAHTVGSWLNYTRGPTGWSDSRERVAISLGDVQLKVPANMMRRVEERIAGGSVDRLSLAVLWPSMEGYSEFNARAFADPSDTSAVMLVSLEPLATADIMDTSERLTHVWLSLASGDPLPGPAGLALLPLPGDAASGTDFVAHRSQDGRLFATRCFTPRDKTLAASCERSIRLGHGLFATYRFRQWQLEHWQSLDDGVAALVARFAPQPAS
ncbi:hypothetical protein [Stappia sp. TSB10GB4]|uniref:hypothetical protein n=1 Tax=Stappia sp. TSB10GB4 TaxID=2003584 RepID=UPI0016468A79|nr:hypothetical protein [Stappia sp. TSB10GB4]